MNKTNTKKALTIMFAGMAAVAFAVDNDEDYLI